MNKKQKVLTGLSLPVFLLEGLMFIASDGIAAAFTGWFALGVVYAGLFFILGPSKPN